MTLETRYKFKSEKVATEKDYEQTILKNPITIERDKVVVLIGGSIIVIGVILYLGNISGIFSTFPFAGFIITTLGGLIINSAPKVFKFQCTKCNKIMRFRITSEEKILTIKCNSCQSEYIFIKQIK